MSEKSLIAIVVTSWNGLKDTLACLTALQRLEYSNRCTVLVDNGSRDKTEETVRRYFPEVEIIANATNTGYVHANNQGIAWALEQGADWILLLNNDVVMACDSLSEMLRVGESSSDIGIVGPVMQRTLRPDILDLGGDLDFYLGQVILRRHGPALHEQASLLVDYVWGCALMARREVFEKLGGLNPTYVAYFEDAELCWRARPLGYRTATALNAHVTHQVGRSGEKRFAWQTALRIRNHAYFFLRFSRPYHWPTLIPGLLLVQLPLIFIRSVRVYLARKIRKHKYAFRPITLWGYERSVKPPSTSQIKQWLDEANYPSHG